MVTHYATLLRGRPSDRRSLPLWFILLRSPLSLPSRHPLFYVLCFMFYVLFGLDFYGVCMCWIMDLECLCLVLRLWQRCIVTRLGPRQSSRLSFFPTHCLPRRLLLSRFSIASPLSSPVVVFSVVVFSFVPLRRFHLGIISTLASSSVLQPRVLRSSFLALGSRVDSRP